MLSLISPGMHASATLEVPRAASLVRLHGEALRLVRRSERQVQTPNGTLTLSRREAALLGVMLETPGVVVSRQELLARVWGSDHRGTPRVLDVRIADMRKKLGAGARECIETVHGVGYRYVPRAGVILRSASG
jgi:DNA-binding response OmpR family regulator